MNTDRHDVAVLGLGGVGGAVFSELARRGVDVVGIDRHRPPHTFGSSHGQSRIFRVAYFEHPDYVPLAMRARRLWCELDRRSGHRVFAPTGMALIGTPDCELVAGSLLAAREHGLDHELLEPEEVRRRWPALHPPDGSVCFHESDSGVLCPENAVRSFLEEGVGNGGTLRCGECVKTIDLDGPSVRMRTEDGVIEAGRLVVAAGAWTAPLVPGEVPLQPTRQLLGWTRGSDPASLEEGRVPIWAFADEPDSFQYGFPICRDFPGPRHPKVARHCDGEPCDPDTVDREIHEADESFLLRNLAAHVPAADGPLVEARVCLYTLSPDRHFVIDRHPHDERVVVASGFSGHGFKFCTVLGEAAADLALEGGTALPIDFLARSRPS